MPSQENPMTFSGSAWILEQEIGTKMSNQNPAPAEELLKKRVITSEFWLLTQPLSGHGPEAWGQT